MGGEGENILGAGCPALVNVWNDMISRCQIAIALSIGLWVCSVSRGQPIPGQCRPRTLPSVLDALDLPPQAVSRLWQALLEEVVYNDQGQLISGGFNGNDMLLPESLPMFTTENTVTPTPHNPMGAKGIGEAGTIGATPAVVSAVVDALSHLGVTHIDIPLRSDKIWRILREHPTAQSQR